MRRPLRTSSTRDSLPSDRYRNAGEATVASRPRGLGVTGVYVCGVYLEHVAIVVDDYGPAIEFFVDLLGFELVGDSPAMTTDGRPKRWVVVRPPGAQTGILLARADGEHQVSAVGRQFAGRVGLFLRVADFEAVYQRMRARGVDFVSEPRTEPYGRVAVFLDIAGNRWDLLGST